MDFPVKTPLQLRPLLVGFRKAAGLTQARIATHLGVTQQTYAQLEAKPESASMDRLFQVLTLLGVTVVLTQTLDAAESKRAPGRPPADAPSPPKQSPIKKRTSPPATKTPAPRKSASKPGRTSAQSTPKPVTRKRLAPTATAPKKREDW